MSKEEIIAVKNDIVKMIYNYDSVFEVRVIDKVGIENNKIDISVYKNAFNEIVVEMT